MSDALAKGRGKPGGFPYADKAPTGRAKCMQCEEPIAKDSIRVAVEREIDTGSMVTRGAGYLHPKCVAENLENVGGDKDELIAALRNEIDPKVRRKALATMHARDLPKTGDQARWLLERVDMPGPDRAEAARILVAREGQPPRVVITRPPQRHYRVRDHRRR